eukprot:353946-Chlamydomonas_euryale.AAC.2
MGTCKAQGRYLVAWASTGTLPGCMVEHIGPLSVVCLCVWACSCEEDADQHPGERACAAAAQGALQPRCCLCPWCPRGLTRVQASVAVCPGVGCGVSRRRLRCVQAAVAVSQASVAVCPSVGCSVSTCACPAVCRSSFGACRSTNVRRLWSTQTTAPTSSGCRCGPQRGACPFELGGIVLGV